jgi:hypothetical protein
MATAICWRQLWLVVSAGRAGAMRVDDMSLDLEFSFMRKSDAEFEEKNVALLKIIHK